MSTNRNLDETYDTVFQTTNGFALILRIYLSTDVNLAPTMTLHGVRATHAWLDIRMRVIGYSHIASDNSWRTSNIKLGDAVYAVIQHFQVNPPSILEITDANLRRLQESLTTGSSSTRLSGSTNNNHGVDSNQYISSASSGVQRSNEYNGFSNGHSRSNNQRPTLQNNDRIKPKAEFEVDDDDVNGLIPPTPASFRELHDMPSSEVKRIVDNRAFLDLFVEGTSEVSTLRELKQSIEASNVDVARANLAHEAKIEKLTTDIETLKQDLNMKLQRYRELDSQRLALTQPPSTQDVIAKLTMAKRDAYRESEEYAEQWIEESGGGEDVSEFIKKFIGVRQLYHIRAAKVERLESSEPHPNDDRY